jgi:hypothetical protein
MTDPEHNRVSIDDGTASEAYAAAENFDYRWVICPKPTAPAHGANRDTSRMD